MFCGGARVARLASAYSWYSKSTRKGLGTLEQFSVGRTRKPPVAPLEILTASPESGKALPLFCEALRQDVQQTIPE